MKSATWVQQVEGQLYTSFPLIYILAIFPSSSPAGVFTTPKTYLLGVFLLLALLLRTIGARHLDFKKIYASLLNQPNYIFWLLSHMAVLVISSLFSDFANQAWFGDPNPQTGAVFFLALGFAFWFYATGPRLSSWSLVTLLVVLNILAITEYLGFRPLEFIVNRNFELTSPFPATTVGIRTHLSAIMLMLIFIPIYWYRSNYFRKGFWALLIIAGIGFGCTVTSSAIAGLIASLMILIVFMRRQLITAILIIITIICAINMHRPLMLISIELQHMGWVSQIAQTKDLSNTTTLQTRLILWKAATLLFKQRPFLGWGISTYNQHWFQVLPRGEGDRLFRLELGLRPTQKVLRINDSAAYKDLNGNTIPVQLNYFAPHNALLDLAYSQGILGVVTFTGFIISLIFYLYERAGRVSILALLPIFAYGIYLLAWFVTVPAMGLAAFLLGGQVAHLCHTRERANMRHRKPLNFKFHQKTSGFTLIELLVVVSIISMLAMVLIPGILAARQRSYNISAQSCSKSIQTVQAISQIDNKIYLLLGNDVGQLNRNSDGVNPICRDSNVFFRNAPTVVP
jgi:prepilin-type N-terminal cleavage/methylation domain-containing protein